MEHCQVIKNEIYVIKIHINNTHTQFQCNIFIFGCAITKNKVKVMTSVFETHFLAFLIVVHNNKGHFWNPETKLDNEGMFL